MVIKALSYPFVIIIFLPALAYRWSLKSSALVWLPLIWIVNPLNFDKFQNKETAKQHIQHANTNFAATLKRWLSKIVLIIFCLKAIFYVLGAQKEKSLYEFILATDWIKALGFLDIKIVNLINLYLINPLYYYPWQITALLCAILTYIGYWRIHKILTIENDYKNLYPAIFLQIKTLNRLIIFFAVLTSLNLIGILLHLAGYTDAFVFQMAI